MQELVVDLEQEYDASGFLGVTLERDLNTGLLYMKNTGIMHFFIGAVVLDDVMSKGKFIGWLTREWDVQLNQHFMYDPIYVW